MYVKENLFFIIGFFGNFDLLFRDILDIDFLGGKVGRLMLLIVGVFLGLFLVIVLFIELFVGRLIDVCVGRGGGIDEVLFCGFEIKIFLCLGGRVWDIFLLERNVK